MATVSPAGHPRAATVSYASKDAVVYFSTGKTTEKYKDILANPNVAYTVDEAYEDWNSIKGLQVIGNAHCLKEVNERDEAKKILGCKFPQMAHMPENINRSFFKIDPTIIYFLDNEKGFGHRDKVTF